VSVLRANARYTKRSEFLPVIEHIDRRAFTVTAFDDNGFRSQGDDSTRGFFDIFGSAERHADKLLRFRYVRGYRRRQRYQSSAKRGDRVFLDQQIARRCHHDGIDDQILQTMFSDFFGDYFNNLRVRQHAGFERVRADVVNHSIDLRRNNLRV
jgi:hypothetical protein